MGRSARSCRSTSRSFPDEDAEVPDERAVDSERMGLDEFEELGTTLDPPFIGEHYREIARARKEVSEGGKRPRVQSIDRLAPSRCRAAVRRIRRNSMDRSCAQGRASSIGDGEIGTAIPRMQRGPGPDDHPPLAIQTNTAKS